MYKVDIVIIKETHLHETVIIIKVTVNNLMLKYKKHCHFFCKKKHSVSVCTFHANLVDHTNVIKVH